MVQRCVSILRLSFNLASLVTPPGTPTLETPFVTYLRLTPRRSSTSVCISIHGFYDERLFSRRSLLVLHGLPDL